jgi:hypothetical protein
MTTFNFIILILATWRLANLFANESGPANIFGHIRNWADRHSAHTMRSEHEVVMTVIYADPKAGSLIDGLSCEWCNSVWFGTILTATYLLTCRWGYAGLPWISWACLPLALSTCAIIIKFIRELLEAQAKKGEC